MTVDIIGGGGKGPPLKNHGSWAQMVESSFPSCWRKNVLEVVLEKDVKGAFNVTESECLHLLKKLGVDPRPGVHLDQIQICPSGRGVILITLKQGVDITRFCRYDVFQITNSGIRAVNVKPAGKREVVLTLRGLHPNTRDDGVINYLGKFGKVITNKVVYGTFGNGPLLGIKNGDRSYKVEINPGINVGNYHAIDGQRVTIRYPGQLQTCARCFETARTCKGGAIARKCEAQNGPKVEFSAYIQDLWKKIEYEPGMVEMAAIYDDHGEADDGQDLVTQAGGPFSPDIRRSEPEKFGGVSIKHFPRDTDTGEIIEYLVNAGLPESAKDTVLVKSNGTVAITELDNEVCLKLIENIHNKVAFGKKIFCNGIIPLTPEKSGNQVSFSDISEKDKTKDMFDKAVDETAVVTDHQASDRGLPVNTESLSGSHTLAGNILAATGSTPHRVTDVTDNVGTFQSGSKLARRHSLSLRSPPPGSLASELLANTQYQSISPSELFVSNQCQSSSSSLAKTKNLLSEVQDMRERLSSYGTCNSDSTGDETDTFSPTPIPRGFKRKSNKVTPVKNDLGKKANLECVNLDWTQN